MSNKIGTKDTLNMIAAVLIICITGPLWFCIVGYILQAAGASSTMWVAFGIYVATALISGILKGIAANKSN